ncbi:alcohol dehydrogenase (GroES-like domain-containing protein) [Colletotrichum truncatum]|uniref:Alcohol dehydrogenase (GroES-like domain-containing protein) n=1 Tax=Colletotrichum truncatum TaxID=5467 RepID=A0ACC3ZKX6_COLTU
MCSLFCIYKARQIAKACEPMVLIDLPLKKSGANEIFGRFGPIKDRVPGHETVGDIVSVDDSITQFKGGERVGGPFHTDDTLMCHDSTCRLCQRGQFQYRDDEAIEGTTKDGGYAYYALLREEAVVHVPRDLDPIEVAPLFCAGVIVLYGIRNMKISPGTTVAILVIGGLGHLVVQYASNIGYKTVVLSSEDFKWAIACELGAHIYVNTKAENAVKKLQPLGRADSIAATALKLKVISEPWPFSPSAWHALHTRKASSQPLSHFISFHRYESV